MSANPLNQGAQEGTVKEVQQLSESKGIKKAIMDEAQQLAKLTADHILDPSKAEPPKYPGINIEGKEEEKYLLILEYLESVGLKMSPSVLRYESQHPDLKYDRKELADHLGLRSYDRTPLLVQLLELILKSFADDDQQGEPK